jgi:hypothetical protein
MMTKFDQFGLPEPTQYPPIPKVEKMNDRLEHCLYQSGLTAQGCWDELDDYARQGIERFAQLIVRECMNICAECEEDIRIRIKDEGKAATAYMCRAHIKEHFGVE